MRVREFARERLEAAPFYALGALVCLALKRFYSAAGAEDLAWILAPACRLVEILSGSRFEREDGAGWISRDDHLVVGPSCAGLNFLIIAFATCFLSFVHRLRSRAARAAWLLGSLGLAYLLTVAANAVRILAAARLYRMDVYGGFVTAERVHLAAGAVVYVLALLATYHALDAAFDRLGTPRSMAGIASTFVPLGWYLAFVLVVPLLNGASRRDAGRFWAGSLVVLAVCLSLAPAGAALRAVRRRIPRGSG
jgi:exosortase K